MAEEGFNCANSLYNRMGPDSHSYYKNVKIMILEFTCGYTRCLL